MIRNRQIQRVYSDFKGKLPQGRTNCTHTLNNTHTQIPDVVETAERAHVRTNDTAFPRARFCPAQFGKVASSPQAKLTLAALFSCESWAASPFQRSDQFIRDLERGSDQGPVTVRSSTAPD